MTCMRQAFRAGVVLNGRYESLSYVHEGSFGMVFKALDLTSGDVVALKCLTKRSAVEEDEAEYAIDDSEELALHERLGRHPNIVNLITSFETEAHLYLVLEYCERGDLYEAIYHNTGPVETEKIRRLMLQLLDAVAYIHSKGIYHRDIKPENIFLSDSGTVKLGDFGLSTSEEISYENAVGSDRYMAPEQCESDEAGYSAAKADLWAVGICLLNVLFKKNPFTKPTAEDAFFRDFCKDSRSLFDIFDVMSEDTFEVLDYCLNLSPARRSLEGARDAILRVKSFTTTEDDCDVFLAGSPRAQATAHREPLDTPCMTPAIEQGAWGEQFWTNSLVATPPQAIRSSKLSHVHDVGSYSEDLFATSAQSNDWCSSDPAKSLASTYDSGFKLTLPEHRRQQFMPESSSLAGSLPIDVAKPQMVPSLSMIFGRRDSGPKSWSDMLEEDLEEESELTRKLNALKQNNARTFSHDSTSNSVTSKVEDHRGAGAVERAPNTKRESEPAAHEVSEREDMGDCLFMYEPPSPKRESQANWPRYSPPPKRTPSSSVDKWAALGQRRRAYAETPAKKRSPPPRQVKVPSPTAAGATSSLSPDLNRTRRNLGFGYSNNYSLANTGAPDQHSHTFTQHFNHHTFNRNRDQPKDACPWTRRHDVGRNDCRESTWRKERRHDLGKMDWVGGCLTARS